MFYQAIKYTEKDEKMLSKYEMQKDMLIGNICIVLFVLSNVKENSVNLATSDFAYIFHDYEGEFEGRTY